MAPPQHWDYQPEHPGLREDGLEPPEPKESYPIFHPHNVIQYADEIYVWHAEAGLLGGVGYSLDDANAQMNRYVESFNAQPASGDQALEKAKLHARSMLESYTADGHSSELTRGQYLAIFGELPE